MVSILNVAALIAGAAGQAQAAVPTVEEYNGGEGSRPKTNNYLNSARKRSSDSSAPPDTAAAAAVPHTKQEYSAAIDAMLTKCTSLTSSIEGEQWDTVVAAAKARPLALLRAAHFGAASAKALSGTLNSNAAVTADISEAAAEVNSNLLHL